MYSDNQISLILYCALKKYRLQAMKCRSCGSESLAEFVNLGRTPPANNLINKEKLHQPDEWFPLLINVCEQCFLVQTQDFIAPSDIFTPDYVYFSSYSSSWTQHAEKFVTEAIDKLNLKQDSFVVEIASNDGYLLQFVKKNGLRCLGIEPADETAAVAVSKGIDVLNDFFSYEVGLKVSNHYGKADLIVANNVLAHVAEPLNLLRGIHVLLKKTGVASIEFHSIKELMKRMSIDTIYHEHFSYYSLTSFKKLVEITGLKVVDVEEIETHGGSLRVLVARDDSRNDVTKSVNRLLAIEKSMGLKKIETYKRFANDVSKIKTECLNFLSKAKAEGYKVVGYGAAAKCSTILNYVGISKDYIPFIADKSSQKVGKHIPGCRIPIVDVKTLVEFEPDYVIIFPWNIKEEIIAELKNKLLKPVKFFQLTPEITLIN